ncbi:hypothetical protein CHLNCDRAFT_134959 [Chlorella variabilis]|uniref:RING-type domain-containing protein n=1 Tax=Chlorella variabilis TaxID=554065 RepID=E1ZH79_CHLVA|nr:hypothetical protein CHLNCDRAFT_134959 [Chlorella variabilis]EFN55075.1 hypothetical protein CHLNCDRAFT_134959 [Chlorella variabilis]|eukprot:XP_005847177.1 hypothetical protein CHLNCDRAFT_134959 [Chlorella variabilis]
MPPVVRQSPLLSEPCLMLAVYTLVSGAGVYSQLTASKEGQEAAGEAAKMLHLATSGYDVDTASAKRLAFATLEMVLQTQLGVFFAANLAAGVYAGFTLVTKTLFLGQLTASETSQLAEARGRGWERFLKFAMLKVAFLAVVRSPGYGGVMQASWLAWCAVICWFSMFTKLASLRGDALLSSPSATLAQHLRILLLLGGILAQDLSWVAGFLRTARGMQGGSLSHALLWLFDATFVAVDAAYALLKYAVQAWDHCKVMRAEVRGEEREPWEGRTELVYWLNLAADLTLLGLSLFHYLHLWWLHGLQLQLIDGVLFLDVRLLVGVIRCRVRRHLSYRRLQHQLRHSFADATVLQLAEHRCCICLDSMKAGKLLPCGHVMHVSCLCAWLQQNATGSIDGLLD